jgi:hypothetical protein
MYIIDTSIEDVCLEFPKTKKWLKTIHKKFLNKDLDMSKVVVYFSYGFFVSKEKKNIIEFDDLYKMKFKKRLKYELSKVRVDIGLEIGTFRMTTRLENLIPKNILNIVTELTKVKMIIEGEFHQNKKVINSIPEVDTSIIQYKIVREDGDYIKDTFDLDKILDKISNDGIKSLTPEEKEFLDKKSNGLN